MGYMSNLIPSEVVSLSELTGWTATTNCTLARRPNYSARETVLDTERYHSSLKITASSAADATFTLTDHISITSGRFYKFNCFLRPTAASRSVAIYIQWFDATGTRTYNDDSLGNATFAHSTDTWTLNSHGLEIDDLVRFADGGSAAGAAGYALGTFYWVVAKTANTFQLSATQGGAVINGTSDSSGSWEARQARKGGGSWLLRSVRWYAPNVAEFAPDQAVRAKVQIIVRSAGSGEETYLSYPAFMPYYQFQSSMNYRVQDYLPDFFLEADDTDITFPMPLRRFIDVATTTADEAQDDIVSWKLLRAADRLDNTTTLSRLGDPTEAKVTWLPWLAQHLGITFTNRDSGTTPWQGFQSGGSFLQWDEWEAAETDAAPAGQWIDLETYDEEFFGAATQYRRQIASGYNGILAGRPETMEQYLEALLNEEEPFLIIKKHYRGNPHRIGVVINEDADPDPGGDMLLDSANLTVPAGSVAEIVYDMWNGGDRVYTADDLLTSLGWAAASIPSELTMPMVPCDVGSGYNLKTVEVTDISNETVWGGGVGPAFWFDGHALYSGGVEAVTDTLATDITGELEVRLLVARLSPPADGPTSRWLCGVKNKWSFYLESTGKLKLVWKNSSNVEKVATSTEAVDWTPLTPFWIRASLTQSGSDQVVGFFTTDSMFDDSWYQVGLDVTLSSSTGIRSSTDGVRLLSASVGGFGAT